MANFNKIKKLNEKYGKTNPIVDFYYEGSIDESFNPTKINQALQGEIEGVNSEYIRFFNDGLDIQAALLFVDVCGFSTRFSELKGNEISKYFDEYYDLIIPIIYDFGGEIDKIMGDGIIAVFAPPFSNKEIHKLVSDVNLCATRIIEESKETKFSSKVAIHSGVINYYHNKSDHYSEYTMIGKPLTELFRLESVSVDESINFFIDTELHELHKSQIEKSNMMRMLYPMSDSPYTKHHVSDLKGIDYGGYYSLKV
jgi:class 3 adenylate cyclase